MNMTNYEKYRGKCKETCEAVVAEDPTLTIVRGHYWCPIWNREEQHWWTKRADGSIYDPTELQFPSAGSGVYTEFDGIITCEQCGKRVKEEDAKFYGRYAFCSGSCICRCVGVA